MVKIKDLKKGDIFIFNDIRYTVRKKYKSDDFPLVADELGSIYLTGDLFHNEELNVKKI